MASQRFLRRGRLSWRELGRGQGEVGRLTEWVCKGLVLETAAFTGLLNVMGVGAGL